MHSLDTFAAQKLAQLERASLRRTVTDTERVAPPYVIRDGRRLLSFSCNDYLGLSAHPAIKTAAIEAIETYGTGAGASRLVTGNHPLYDALETKLARIKGTASACVFGSGYLANVGVLSALAGRDDLILIDTLAHACLHAGAQLSRAKVLTYRHNDVAHVAELLAAYRAQHRHAMIVTETVFSMDGDRAPLTELASLAVGHDAWLVTDDAHGFGVGAHDDVAVPLQLGTLSKAIGAYGGYCCASAPVIDFLKTRARTLVYSTGLPPATVAAALAALDIIERQPELVDAPIAKAQRFTRHLNLSDARSAIVPLVLGDPKRALALSTLLEEAGFLVAAIRPPTVPEGTARLRFAFSALHEGADIDRLAEIIAAQPDLLRHHDLCPASS